MYKISILICIVSLFITNESYSIDYYCPNTQNAYVDKINSDAESYKKQGFSPPANLQLQIDKLRDIERYHYPKSVGISTAQKVNNEVTNLTGYVNAGIIGNPSDCMREVFSNICSGGYTVDGYNTSSGQVTFSAQCKGYNSNASTGNSGGSGGGFRKLKDGSYTNR